jgi:hypothetical protein
MHVLLIQLSNSGEVVSADRARAIASVTSSKWRGRRECRVHDAPIASCAMKKAHERSHYRCTEINRHSLRDGFTVSFVLFPGTGLVVPVVRRVLHDLGASVGAPEPHDFAVRNMRRSSAAPLRPSHSVPNVRDDRDTPL